MKDAETGAGVLGGAREYRETIIILRDGSNYTAIFSSNFEDPRRRCSTRLDLYASECATYGRSGFAMRERMLFS